MYIFVFLITFVLKSNMASAEVLKDPTRPPSYVGSAINEQLSEAEQVPVLQLVTLGSETQFAMINGKTIKIGGQYLDQTLIKLTAQEAVLRAPDGKTQILKMDYQVKKVNSEKQVKASPPAAKKKHESTYVVMEAK